MTTTLEDYLAGLANDGRWQPARCLQAIESAHGEAEAELVGEAMLRGRLRASGQGAFAGRTVFAGFIPPLESMAPGDIWYDLAECAPHVLLSSPSKAAGDAAEEEYPIGLLALRPLHADVVAACRASADVEWTGRGGAPAAPAFRSERGLAWPEAHVVTQWLGKELPGPWVYEAAIGREPTLAFDAADQPAAEWCTGIEDNGDHVVWRRDQGQDQAPPWRPGTPMSARSMLSLGGLDRWRDASWRPEDGLFMRLNSWIMRAGLQVQRQR